MLRAGAQGFPLGPPLGVAAGLVPGQLGQPPLPVGPAGGLPGAGQGLPWVPGAPLLPPVMPGPDRQQLIDQLRSQIEFYFSDENMERDFYLRRQMTSEGYVALTVLIGFARVRSIAAPIDNSDYGILAMLLEALMFSATLELDPSGGKARRRRGWQRFVLQDATPESGPG